VPDPTAELFDRLGRRGCDPLLEQARGTVRFDLASDTEILYWSVILDRGNVRVTRDEGDADCIVHTTKARFDKVATGAANAMAMLLRAEIIVHGDVQLLVVLERLLPGPPGARGPRMAVGER
jgi:hypothetical protein